MRAVQKRLHHPGYDRRGPDHEPPSVRFGFLIATEPLGDTPSTPDLRRTFCNLLDQPPIMSLVAQLTAVASGASWRSYGGNGRLALGAILGSTDQDENAPTASATLNLYDKHSARSCQCQSTELVLYVEPRDDSGAPAPPATLERWYDRLLTMLEVPAAFANYLSGEIGLDTYASPSAQVGVSLGARPTVAELVDTRSLQRVAGSSATSSFPSYLIADPNGHEPGQTGIDVLRVWCDYALYVDGYEDLLASLSPVM